MASAESSVNLAGLFSRSLQNASKASKLPTVDESTQELIAFALQDLTTMASRIFGMSLFSPNETLEDITTKDLVYLLVPSVIAELQGRVRTVEMNERLATLGFSQKHLKSFLVTLENYDIIPESERSLHDQKVSAIKDPAKRREMKINQYKIEKDIRARIETLQKRRRRPGSSTASDASTDFDLISSLLPLTLPEEEDEDSEIEDVLRETTLLVLRLCYAQANAQLESMDQELELLRNAPSSPTQQGDSRLKAKDKEFDMWKVDQPQGIWNAQGPLIDRSGKPLRPFTILPAGAADRARMQSQVFGPGYNLPTMSVDEYLQIEQERGNIISGGGAASAAAPTTSEQLAVDAEMDGTRIGEEREEMKRQKDENWAQFTDANPKGAGNTMNRG